MQFLSFFEGHFELVDLLHELPRGRVVARRSCNRFNILAVLSNELDQSRLKCVITRHRFLLYLLLVLIDDRLGLLLRSDCTLGVSTPEIPQNLVNLPVS